MKNFLLVLVMIFITNLSNGQCKIPKLIEKKITETSTNEDFGKEYYYKIHDLLDQYEVTDNLKCLIKSDSYSKNINGLFNSETTEKRLLAYRLISVAKDSTFNDELINRINSKEDSSLKTWSAMALMANNCSKASDDLFKLFSSYPDSLPSGILSKMYIQYNHNAVKKTCWKFVDSKNRQQQVLAVQCLASYEEDEKLQTKLLEYVNTWEDGYKGYIIYAMSLQNMENLKPVLEKYVNTGNLKQVIIMALKIVRRKPTVSSRKSSKIKTKQQDINANK
jgi:hypothetical protein